MAIFVTGATGFIGSYVLPILLEKQDEPVLVLTRATTREQALEKFWKALQLHVDAATFYELMERVEHISGDLTAPDLGMSAADRERVAHSATSFLHVAASLNRKSSKVCFNTNLRGTLSLLKLARQAADHHGLRRFSYVSTVAVAGMRDSEVVQEDTAVDWSRSDYELLPDVPKLVMRPSIVMGDSRFPQTSQFDMVRAFCLLSELPVVPLSKHGRLDIVNADFVGHAIANLHLKDELAHEIYHLSSGVASLSAYDVACAVAEARGKRPPRFVPALEGGFKGLVDLLGLSRRRDLVTQVAALLKVFLPYITYDTVFDNSRVIKELGVAPVPFTEYCAGLYHFAKGCDFSYPHVPLPAREVVVGAEEAA